MPTCVAMGVRREIENDGFKQTGRKRGKLKGKGRASKFKQKWNREPGELE